MEIKSALRTDWEHPVVSYAARARLVTGGPRLRACVRDQGCFQRQESHDAGSSTRTRTSAALDLLVTRTVEESQEMA